MPLPKRTPIETKDEFISRCMEDLSSEFPDRKQRAAVCYTQLKQVVDIKDWPKKK